MTKTINYKGYFIETETASQIASIYEGRELVKCVAGDLAKDYTHNAVDKAKIFIDKLKTEIV